MKMRLAGVMLASLLAACGDDSNAKDMAGPRDMAANVVVDMASVGAVDMAGAVVDMAGAAGDLSAQPDLAGGGGGDMAQKIDMMAPSDGANSIVDGSNGPKTVTVTVGPNNTTTFSPPNVTLAVGDSIKWVWAAAGHNVVSGTNGVADNKFCSPLNNMCAAAPTSPAGASWSFTFKAAGVFPYFCKPHFNAGMTGTITVQ